MCGTVKRSICRCLCKQEATRTHTHTETQDMCDVPSNLNDPIWQHLVAAVLRSGVCSDSCCLEHSADIDVLVLLEPVWSVVFLCRCGWRWRHSEVVAPLLLGRCTHAGPPRYSPMDGLRNFLYKGSVEDTPLSRHGLKPLKP